MDNNRVDNLCSTLNGAQNELNVDTLLDCMNSLIKEISVPAFKNNKCVDAFLKRYRKQYEQLERSRVGSSDFTYISMLGKGAFGQVKLVRHNASEGVYAMKCILKSEMLTRPEGMSSFWEERYIMAFAHSDWLVKCHWAFQDTKYLYMVMDYMPGGNLLSGVLDNEDLVTTEVLIKFYTAEMILAIEALHDMGYAHRDIKPDNCLIDSKGHLKMTDFGTAIRVDETDGQIRCSTAVGTPDYISPEVLKSQSSSKCVYGRECDWWSLGVVIFEMKYQDTPFYDEALVKTYSKINQHVDKLDFPPDEEGFEPASLEIMDLIEKCLTADRTKRIGYRGARELKAHSFFNEKVWTWENIHTHPAPFDPQIQSDTDSRHFNYDSSQDDTGNKFGSLDIHSSRNNATQFNAEQLPFVGFSYFPELFNRLICNGSSESGETVVALQKQLEDAIKTCEKYQNNYNKAELNRSQIETECNDLKRKLAKTEVENQSYVKKFEDVSSRLHKCLAENESQKNQLGALTSEKKNLTNNLNEKVRELESENLSLNETVNGEKIKNNELNKRIAENEKRLKEVQMRLDRECAENVNLINDLQNRQKEFDTIYSELSGSQVKINSLEETNRILKEQLDALTKSESENKSSLNEKQVQLREANRNYEQMKMKYEQKEEEVAELKKSVEQLKERLEIEQENKASADIESQGETSVGADKGGSVNGGMLNKDEYEEMKKNVTKLELELKQEVQNKSALLDKLRSAESELCQVKYDLEMGVKSIEQHQQKEEEKDRVILGLETKMSELNLEKSKLNVEVNRKKAELEMVKNKEVTLGREVNGLKEIKTHLEEEKNDLLEQLESAKMNGKEIEEECESMKMKMTLLLNKIDDLKDDKNEMNSEKDNLLDEINSLKKQIDTNKQKLVEKDLLVSKYEQENIELNQNLQLEQISSEEKLNKQKYEIEKKSEEISDLRNLVENNKSEKSDLMNKIKKLNDDLQNLSQERDTLKSEMVQLKEERKRLIEHFSNFVQKGASTAAAGPGANASGGGDQGLAAAGLAMLGRASTRKNTAGQTAAGSADVATSSASSAAIDKNSAAARNNRKLQMELEAHKQNVRRYENEIRNVRHELDQLRAQFDEKEREYEALKGQLLTGGARASVMMGAGSAAAAAAAAAATNLNSVSRASSRGSFANILDTSAMSVIGEELELYHKEGKMEIQQSQIMGFLTEKKNQRGGKKTQKFIEQYVVLEGSCLTFFKNADDFKNYQKNPAMKFATQVIDLTKLIYVRQAHASELFREKKEDVEKKVFQIVFNCESSDQTRKKDETVIFEWASHQMRIYTGGNINSLTCDACNKPFKNTTLTSNTISSSALPFSNLKGSSASGSSSGPAALDGKVIECKHCGKKYHKDKWDEEKLLMHKCPLANKANDTVMYLKAKNEEEKKDWMEILNKFCTAFNKHPKYQQNQNQSFTSSIAASSTAGLNNSQSDLDNSGGRSLTVDSDVTESGTYCGEATDAT